jgi:hypothetical protein
MKYYILIGLLLAIILISGCIQIINPKSPIKLDKSCNTDDECVFVRETCCSDCCSKSDCFRKNPVVNKETANKIEQWRKSSCNYIICMYTSCIDVEPYLSLEAKCINNTCAKKLSVDCIEYCNILLINNSEKKYVIFNETLTRRCDCYGNYEIFCEQREGKEKDECYFKVALTRNNKDFCKEINDVNTKDNCIKRIAVVVKNESICNLLTKNIDECYTDIAVIKDDPYICFKLGDVWDIGNCLNVGWIYKEKEIGNISCVKFNESMKRDLCYSFTKQCDKISPARTNYDQYLSIKEHCILHNIAYLATIYNFNESVNLCKEIQFDFYEDVCLQNLAKGIAKTDLEKSLSLINMINDKSGSRRNIMLAIIAEEIQYIDNKQAVEICEMITLEEKRSECLHIVTK